jgi:hypothetical protein
MSLIRVTKDNKCIYCGAPQAICTECQCPFHATSEDHVLCGDRCRQRRSRRLRVAALPTLEELYAPKS